MSTDFKWTLSLIVVIVAVILYSSQCTGVSVCAQQPTQACELVAKYIAAR